MPPKASLEAGKKWTTEVLRELCGEGFAYEWGKPWSEISRRQKSAREAAEQIIVSTSVGRKILWIPVEDLRSAAADGPEQNLARTRIRAAVAKALGQLLERARK